MATLREKVAVIGSGNIGRSWTLLYTSAGYDVSLYDNNPDQLSSALKDIQGQLHILATEGLSRGDLEPDEQMTRITLADDVTSCMQDACIIVECVPEVLDIKRQVLQQADHVMKDDVILASSTSALLPSVLSEGLKHQQQLLVIHPVNPPFYARAVELVPSPWTSAEVMQRARDVMVRLGQAPIVMKKEIEGFVLNRIHFAVLAECWRLLKDGVVDAEGIDKAVWSGLGPRYAFIGPFQVGHLNAVGIDSYLERYGPTILRLQSTMTHPGRMGGELAQKVQDDMEKVVPLDAIPERRLWRQVRMARLAKMKRDLDLMEAMEVERGKMNPLPKDC